MARAFLNRGYQVDLIDWLDDQFVPEKNYKFFIDIYLNLERIGKLLNNDCVKILHIVRAHWMHHNKAEYKRLLALQERKRVALKPRRQMDISHAIECADYATILGNGFALRTYDYIQKPIYSIPIATCATYPWPQDKDFENCKRNFLWFGSVGFVHKGLDLLLDAFKEMPDYNLTVCGPIDKEKDFIELYKEELYETPNIHTHGWVDVNSHEFPEIANSCIALLFPSCSEGQSAAVVNCMHAGLLPIVSRQSGFDVQDFGITLMDCSVEEIKETVRSISSLPNQKLRKMAKNTWEYARANHTKENFVEKYNQVIDKIMDDLRSKSKLNLE
jgi:glycosyltransferase involved in cell wall biosynthesis